MECGANGGRADGKGPVVNNAELVTRSGVSLSRHFDENRPLQPGLVTQDDSRVERADDENEGNSLYKFESVYQPVYRR